MKRVLLSGALILAAGVFVFLSTGASRGTAAGTYKIEFQNAFGLVTGADFKVAGVPAGTIKAIEPGPEEPQRDRHHPGHPLGLRPVPPGRQLRSRGPESLIGEYFVDCNPGSSGPVLKAGSTIPVSHTQSTIPADLLQNTMRLPYRQRFTLIVNELGAAAAGRSGDIQAALHRAVPALDQTDNLLNLLANDSTTLQALTKDSNSVITALANNSKNVNRFIYEAGRTASDTATQQANLRGSLQRLPGLLEQLKPDHGAARHHGDHQRAGAAEPQPGLGAARPAPHRPARVLRIGPAGDQVAGPGVGHRQGRGHRRHPDGQGPQRVRQAHPRARRQPRHRPARPRRPQPRRRARPAQPRRQGLHRPAGAARLRLQPGAGDQHLRPRGSRPRRRRVRQPDVLALRHAGHGRPGDQAVRLGLPAVLLVAGPQPARRQRDRSVESERPGARSGRGASRSERAQHERQPPDRRHGAERHQRQQAPGAQGEVEDQEEGQRQGQGHGQPTRPPTAARAGTPSSPSAGATPPSSGGGSGPPIDLGKTIGQVLQGTVGGGPAPSTPTPAVPAPPATSAPPSGSSSSPGNTAQQLLNYLLSP